MKYLVMAMGALFVNTSFAQAVINPGTVNQIAGPGSASVVAPGQIKKDFGVSSRYTAPGQVKKGYQGQGNGNKNKGHQGKGQGK